ncbi:MAG: hypothetical protein ACU85E_16635 [Gammaproteobacteria bacterium]
MKTKKMFLISLVALTMSFSAGYVAASSGIIGLVKAFAEIGKNIFGENHFISLLTDEENGSQTIVESVLINNDGGPNLLEQIYVIEPVTNACKVAASIMVEKDDQGGSFVTAVVDENFVEVVNDMPSPVYPPDPVRCAPQQNIP